MEIEPIRRKVPWWVVACKKDKTEYRKFHITKGYGSGGTFGATIWHAATSMNENADAPTSWVVGPTYAQIEDPALTTYVQVLHDYFDLVPGTDYDLNISGRPKITLPNGHIIRFKSANRPDTLVGENISHVLFTEPGLIGKLAFERTAARLRHPKAKLLQWMLEGTPEGDTYWKTWADFPVGVNEELNARRIILHTADNTHITPEYYEQIYNTHKHDAAKLRSYLYGEFTNFARGTAYWEYTEARTRLGSAFKDPNKTLQLTWDFNISPLAWVCFQRFQRETQYVRRDVFEVHGCSNGKAKGLLDAIADFATQYPVSQFGNTRIEVDGDVSGNGGSWKVPGSDYDVIIKGLRSLGYAKVSLMVGRDNPDVRPRLERMNQLIAYNRLKITNDCQNVHSSLSKTALKQGTFIIEKKGTEDQWSHWADALGYALWRLTQHEDLERPTLKRVYGKRM